MRSRLSYWTTIIVLVAACVVALAFNFSRPAPDEDKQSFSLRFSWAGIPACASVSPVFELVNVPLGTKSLNFTMTDLDVPSFNHGGSAIPYHGNLVSQGAIKYAGPCPPRNERHRYRWTVQALDHAGKELGKTTTDSLFPPTGPS